MELIFKVIVSGIEDTSEYSVNSLIRRVVEVLDDALDGTPELDNVTEYYVQFEELSRFPLYQMLVNGHSHLYTLSEAAAACDSGWAQVSIGEIVIEKDGTERPMTMEEQRRISDLADDYSGNK